MIVKGPPSSSFPSCHRDSADGLVLLLIIDPALLWRKEIWFRKRYETDTFWKSVGKRPKIARGNSQCFSWLTPVVITHWDVRWADVWVETYSMYSAIPRPRTEWENGLFRVWDRPLSGYYPAALEHFTTRWTCHDAWQTWPWRMIMKWKPQQYGWYLTVFCLFVLFCFSLSQIHLWFQIKTYFPIFNWQILDTAYGNVFIFWKEPTGEWWISLTMGQQLRKAFLWYDVVMKPT